MTPMTGGNTNDNIHLVTSLMVIKSDYFDVVCGFPRFSDAYLNIIDDRPQ